MDKRGAREENIGKSGMIKNVYIQLLTVTPWVLVSII